MKKVLCAAALAASVTAMQPANAVEFYVSITI